MKKLCALALLLGGCSAQHATVEPAPQVIVVVATPTPVGAPAAPGSATPAANLVAAPTLVPKPIISKEEVAWLDNFHHVLHMLRPDPTLNEAEEVAAFRYSVTTATRVYDSVPVPPRLEDADRYIRDGLEAASEGGVHLQNFVLTNSSEESDAANKSLTMSTDSINKAKAAADDVVKASQ